MAVSFIVVNMVNIKASGKLRFGSATNLALSAISISYLLFKAFGKLMIVVGSDAIGQAAGKAHTFGGAIFTQVHIRVDKGRRTLKRFTTMLANQHGKFLCPGLVIAGQAAIPSICGVGLLTLKHSAAVLASHLNPAAFPLSITLAATKNVVLCSGVERCAMHQFAAVLARLIPTVISASAGTVKPKSSFYLLMWGKKRLTTGQANSLNALGFGDAHTGAGTILSPGGGEGLKWSTTNEAILNHFTLPVRVSPVNMWGAGYRVPGLSVVS